MQSNVHEHLATYASLPENQRAANRLKMVNVPNVLSANVSGGGVYPVYFMLSFVDEEDERRKIVKELERFKIEIDEAGRLVKVIKFRTACCWAVCLPHIQLFEHVLTAASFGHWFTQVNWKAYVESEIHILPSGTVLPTTSNSRNSGQRCYPYLNDRLEFINLRQEATSELTCQRWRARADGLVEVRWGHRRMKKFSEFVLVYHKGMSRKRVQYILTGAFLYGLTKYAPIASTLYPV
jgi:hypothetical protein